MLSMLELNATIVTVLRGQLLETYLSSSEESRTGSLVGMAGRSCRRRTLLPKEVNFAPKRCDGRP